MNNRFAFYPLAPIVRRGANILAGYAEPRWAITRLQPLCQDCYSGLLPALDVRRPSPATRMLSAPCRAFALWKAPGFWDPGCRVRGQTLVTLRPALWEVHHSIALLAVLAFAGGSQGYWPCVDGETDPLTPCVAHTPNRPRKLRLRVLRAAPPCLFLQD